MRRLFTTFLLCCLFVTIAFAQAPEKFTYQAVVRNANNTLVASSQVGVRVSILQGSTSGSAVYVETQTATTNANGLMTLSIGGGSVQQGTFANIDWANGPFFLKIETDPNGGSNYSVTGTEQLLSVPYALYSKEAGNGFSGDYNDLTNAPQNVSVFTNDADYITNAQLTALLSNLNNRIDSLGTVLGMITPENIDVMSCPEAPTLTDVDGNIYRTVKIGNQCWMRDNLRTEHYSNGTAIPYGASGTSSTTVSYYYNQTGSAIPLEERGYLYNWHAVMHGASSSNAVPSGVQGVCPAGWHVPSYAEWEILFDYLGNHAQYICGADTQYIAKAMASTIGWESSPYNCSPGLTPSTNNTSGFEAVPAGSCINGDFSYAEFGSLYMAHFWSSTIESSPDAYSCNLSHSSPGLHWKHSWGIDDGFSVRCVRDETSGGSTSAVLPTVTTTAASNITETTAVLGGVVTADGGAGITMRGVCYSTSANPTISGLHTSDGAGMGAFTSNLTGLTASTTYYVRAYATNSVGTSYGTEVTFTTQPASSLSGTCPEAPTVTDYDGNVYNTVQIGNQCWMRENLRTTHYADGTPIPADTSVSATSPYYFDYSTSSLSLSERGYLYNWIAAMHGASSSTAVPSGVQGICPTGWHLPSDAEWTALTDYVGGQSQYWCSGNSTYTAKALASTTGWDNCSDACAVGNDQSSNNATGFSIFPAGDYYVGGYSGSGSDTYFWTATETSADNAKFRSLGNISTFLLPYNRFKSNGVSVRCLRD